MISRGKGQQRFSQRVEERLEQITLLESIPASYSSDFAFYCRTRNVLYLRNVFEFALAEDTVLS